MTEPREIGKTFQQRIAIHIEEAVVERSYPEVALFSDLLLPPCGERNWWKFSERCADVLKLFLKMSSFTGRPLAIAV